MPETVLNLSRALETEGWMSDFELEWLAEQASSHQRIVELGSYLGRSTRALADNTPGWVLAFDDWYGPRENIINTVVDGRTGETISEEPYALDRGSLYATFERNVQDLIQSGKVRVLKAHHADFREVPIEFLVGREDEKPDMVFIDGGHEYHEAKRDICNWLPRIAQGGLMCGHDAPMNGVYKAVTEVFGPINIVPFTDIWSVNVRLA